MVNELNQAIVKTLCYAQVFSYPLTVSELWQYLISSKKVSKEEFSSHLYKNKYLFEFEDQYVILPGDRKLVKERKSRMAPSRKKLGHAVFISHILSFIPTIKLIGVSGSLSMHNAKKDDDIDLFFITRKNTLWLTRFFVCFLLFSLSQKRGKNDKYAKDKICPNMFISEDVLCMFPRNIYMAHEIAQMKTIVSKDNMHERFLSKNKWVIKYMPHAFDVSQIKKTKINPTASTLFSVVEQIFFLSQFLYMRKSVTHERVGKKLAAFHPGKRKEAITMMYNLKVASYTETIKSRMKEKRTLELHALN